jgi:predicted permease
MQTLWQDLRYGARMLLKQPGFTLIAVATLALGIGANTAIFTWLKAVFLQPLPGVAANERLVNLHSVLERSGGRDSSLSYPDYKDYRDRNQAFSGLAAFNLESFSMLADGGQPERVFGSLVSGNYFDVLGAGMALGRGFRPEEDRTPGAHPVVVISHKLWQQRFGADRNLIGKTIRLNQREFTVIGVTAAGFGGSFVGVRVDFWAPVMMTPLLATRSQKLDERGAQWLMAIGRLKDGVTFAQAQADVQGIAAQLGKEFPNTNEGIGATLFTLVNEPNGAGQMAPILWLLLAVAGLVLIVACANVAGLLLARAAGRSRELGIRSALGASRGRLLRQMLTESLLLGAAGGAAGMLLGAWLSDAMSWLLPALKIPLSLHLAWDYRVPVFALALTLLTVVAVGVLSAWSITRVNPLVALRGEAGAVGAGRRRSRLRSVLVVAQVAVSLVLLIGAGLFLRALNVQRKTNPGFEPQRALMISMDISSNGYDQKRGVEFYRQLTQRVSALPGVVSASLSSRVPPELFAGSSTSLELEGYTPRGDEQINVEYEVIAPRYLPTMGIPLVEGREFNDADQASSMPVALVNETFAQRYWPGRSAVGRRLRDGDGVWHTVVGVTRDAKYYGASEAARPWLYVAQAQQRFSSMMTLVVRTTDAPERMFAAVRGAVRALDAALPLFDEKTLAAHSSGVLFPDRLIVTFLSAFGLVALTLAALGLYGVLAYAVAQRTREIGIRLALGAQPRAMLALVVKQGMRLALLGIGLGLAAALALTRLLSSLLFGVSATDPLTFVAISSLLALVALVACWIPARRATKVDPMIALRCE